MAKRTWTQIKQMCWELHARHRSAIISRWGPVCPACSPPDTQEEIIRRARDLSETSDRAHTAAGLGLWNNSSTETSWSGRLSPLYGTVIEQERTCGPFFDTVEIKGLVAWGLLFSYRGLWQSLVLTAWVRGETCLLWGREELPRVTRKMERIPLPYQSIHNFSPPPVKGLTCSRFV
jgi:hypothetical protein